MATSERFPSLHLVVAALCIYGATWSVGAAATIGRDGPRILLAQADPDAAPDDSQGASGLLIRIERLEDRLRSMTGQIEQLQFQNKKLEDALRKMQQDVDFRFQDLGRAAPGAARPLPQKRGDVETPSEGAVATTAAAAPSIAETSPAITASKIRRTGDAFDPGTDPNAPGAPKPLGTTTPSEPLPPRSATASRTPASSSSPAAVGGRPHAPMDLMPSTVEAVARPGPAVAAPAAEPPGSPVGNPDRATATPAAVASLAPSGTRGDYESSFALYKGGEYDAAVTGFQTFLQKNPKDRAAADATYFLGESYARLGRHREAAEQFLKLSTDYTRSSRAPDALLRLGIALNALGAKEQACATYQEVDRKFPTASADVRAGVERELKRAKC